jgi:hypothetical protein
MERYPSNLRMKVSRGHLIRTLKRYLLQIQNRIQNQLPHQRGRFQKEVDLD